jgi:LysR family transcriptional regulator for metE and metH
MQDAMKSRSSSITPRFDTRGQFFASLGGQFFISRDNTPVFDYELVLAVHEEHPLASKGHAVASDLVDEELITYPVSFERLDVYTQFLVPGRCRPRRHRTAETTELMLQLVAAKRGVSVVPDWLLREEGADLPLRCIRLGPQGIDKCIHLGVRSGEEDIEYIAGFLEMARGDASIAKSQSAHA